MGERIMLDGACVCFIRFVAGYVSVISGCVLVHECVVQPEVFVACSGATTVCFPGFLWPDAIRGIYSDIIQEKLHSVKRGKCMKTLRTKAAEVCGGCFFVEATEIYRSALCRSIRAACIGRNRSCLTGLHCGCKQCSSVPWAAKDL